MGREKAGGAAVESATNFAFPTLTTTTTRMAKRKQNRDDVDDREDDSGSDVVSSPTVSLMHVSNAHPQ